MWAFASRVSWCSRAAVNRSSQRGQARFDSLAAHDEKGEQTHGHRRRSPLAPDRTGSSLLSCNAWVRSPPAARQRVQSFDGEARGSYPHEFGSIPNGPTKGTTRCLQCKGPFHPATGHMYAKDVGVCGACFRPFVAFYKGRMSLRKDGNRFADAAATSIIAGGRSGKQRMQASL